VVLVSFVAGHLRLVNGKTLGKLALGHALSDANGDEKPANALGIHEFIELTSLKPVIASTSST